MRNTLQDSSLGGFSKITATNSSQALPCRSLKKVLYPESGRIVDPATLQGKEIQGITGCTSPICAMIEESGTTTIKSVWQVDGRSTWGNFWKWNFCGGLHGTVTSDLKIEYDRFWSSGSPSF